MKLIRPAVIRGAAIGDESRHAAAVAGGAPRSREECPMDMDRVSPRGWLIVAMLFCFMLINFADKAVLGLSAVPIMREFGLDHTEFGLIGTSFFGFFSLSAVLVGF